MPLSIAKKLANNISNIFGSKTPAAATPPKYEYVPSATPYQDEEFVIIANNCWGAEVYKKAGKPFNTPFIGLFLFAEDYIRLLENFEETMGQPLRFAKNSKWLANAPSYPIGILGGIEIHFMHYKSEEEALEKWTRRTERLLALKGKTNFFYKMCDRDGATPALIERFHRLPFKNKISFGTQKFPHLPNHIQMAEREQNTVPDGVLTFNLANKYVDLPLWINTGILKKLQ